MLKRTQQKVSNSQDGMNDSQNANFIIAEAKKVLERSYIFYSRNRNQSHNSFNAQRSDQCFLEQQLRVSDIEIRYIPMESLTGYYEIISTSSALKLLRMSLPFTKH